ncbi:hypothetical protein TNCV_3955021 [Trichonephila clavipes]|nr:hypothetical protein TNCV_3955021 [Trichonephila clavipes]
MKSAGWSTHRVASQEDRSEVPLEIVGSRGTREVIHARKPGLSDSGRPRGERFEGSRGGKQFHGTSYSDSFNDTSRYRRSNCSTNNFQAPCRSKILNPSALSVHPFNTEHRQLRLHSGAKPDQCGMSQIGKRLCLVMNPGLFWGQMITVYGCGGALVSGTNSHTVLRLTAHTAGVMVWGHSL